MISGPKLSLVIKAPKRDFKMAWNGLLERSRFLERQGLTMDRPGCFQTIPNEFVVRLHVLPQREQRYDTEGDWLWADNTLVQD